jgi:endonuclease YncB( thermonuclease family)
MDMKILSTLLAAAALSLGACHYEAQAQTSRSYTYDVVDIYDGDTFYIRMDGLPPELSRIGVRVRGVDTPEMRGKCEFEKRNAAGAKLYTTRMIRLAGNKVTLTNLKWDKYGGRVDADVYVNGRNLAQDLIMQSYARPYVGGARKGWCPNG